MNESNAFPQGSSDGGGEQASRGKIVLLKKKVEELEQQLALKNGELENKVNKNNNNIHV